MKPKVRFRIRNWRAYNAALVKRGSLTVWFDNKALAGWYEQEPSGRRGHPYTYSRLAIQCALTVRAVLGLPLRATQGLVASVLDLMGLDLSTPHYSTLCRRQRQLKLSTGHRPTGQALHVVLDATGLKIFGDGEWLVRQHGYHRRRTWRKLHLAVDEASKRIVSAVVTTNDYGDGELLTALIDPIREPIVQVSADKAYDSWANHDYLQRRGIRAAIPPREKARIRQHGHCHKPPLPRDEALRAIRKHGRAAWKRTAGYHRRSLAENAFFRLKTLFGDKLAARQFDSQATEAFLRCRALNIMTQLGMPESYAVAD